MSRHSDLLFHQKYAPYRTRNFFKSFICAQTSGNAIRRLTHLSEVDQDLLDDVSDKLDLYGVPSTLAELDKLSLATSTQDKQKLFETVKTLYSKTVNFEARRDHDRNDDTIYNKFCRIIIEYGGVELLLRILMISSLLPQGSSGGEDSAADLRIKSVCLEILSRFISVKNDGEEVARRLSARDDLLYYCFSLLCHDQTCHTAVQLIEDLLQARCGVLSLNTIRFLVHLLLFYDQTCHTPLQLIEDLLQVHSGVLSLNTISNLTQLVEGLDDRKLANFCRVLSVTISDLDIYENKSSLYAQNKQKRTKGFVNIRDVNQELLLGIPDLMNKLVRIACAKTQGLVETPRFRGMDKGLVETPRFRGMDSELDNWMEWIDNQMAEDAFDQPNIDDLINFVGGISEPTSLNGPMFAQSGLRISMDLVLRVQVIYVLGLFLVGKHRKKVQRKLAELHLIPGLSDMFDNFIWKCQAHDGGHRQRLRGHNSSCECSPEVAVKIQFLRLVHSFCDHSDFKHLLLSKSELNEIKRINSKADECLQVVNVDGIDRQMMCRGSKGLLTKIVEVMKKEPTASTFRFWLARAVESYLRGSTSYCDQIFLLRRGLLQHIAGNIVDHDIKPKEILQSSFDLLGELCKFNVEAFKAFDKVLNTQDRLERFLAVINRNLVDSNMFIRSLVLSYEHFQNAQAHHADYADRECGLLRHVSSFEQQMKYLARLINTINVQNLTQENVSCLNTTLVFFMFANRKCEIPRYLGALLGGVALLSSQAGGTSATQCISNLENVSCLNTTLVFFMFANRKCEIPRYLGALLGGVALLSNQPDGTSATQCISNFSVMKNFRNLLLFWQDHYLHKDKDCSALEKSSRIPFEFWKSTVYTLVEDTREKSTAILHFMDPDFERDC